MERSPQNEPSEKPTAGQIVTGIALTLFALPFLFVATCLPAMFLGDLTGVNIARAVWMIGLIAFGIWRAVVTENPGVRWAIFVAIVAGTITAAMWFWPESTNLLAKR